MTYIYTLLSLVTFDIIWFFAIASDFYKKNLPNILADKINILPALFFYPIYAFAIYYLVILNSKSEKEVLVKAVVLALASFGAYDLTNHATLKDWPLIVTLVDILWGVTATTLTTYIVYKLK